jgi:hypothetical protein
MAPSSDLVGAGGGYQPPLVRFPVGLRDPALATISPDGLASLVTQRDHMRDRPVVESLTGEAVQGSCRPAGLADSTIRNDTDHLELIRAWFGRLLWELPPADADAYFGKVLRDAKPSTRTGRAAALTVFFQLLELRHKVTCRCPLKGRVGSLCGCLRSSAEQAAGR